MRDAADSRQVRAGAISFVRCVGRLAARIELGKVAALSIHEDIAAFLEATLDEGFRAFNAKLLPTVPSQAVVGVRTPALRKFAKQLSRREDAEEFLSDAPHRFFEENQLHAFIVSGRRNYGELVAGIEGFLPYVDNWATCDQMSPRGLAQRPEETLALVRKWLASSHPYTVRYGIGVLLQLFLDDLFRPEMLDWVANVASEEYYVNMMRAWYFAEALAKQPEAALPFIEQRRLDPWTHNKAIQKAIESRRISPDQKSYLRTLKTPL